MHLAGIFTNCLPSGQLAILLLQIYNVNGFLYFNIYNIHNQVITKATWMQLHYVVCMLYFLVFV